ncbi:hypothetical protein LXA43DRAFT_1064336 [Ganoderma leucocontextum]|nr:hypothetical protein LXA43DRAFT_1064336 [Ganoderma leucocontextum]
MSSGYNPITLEAAWYDWWDGQDYFALHLTPDGKIKPEGIFVIPSPPPHVTGSLHIGHALTVMIQDCLIRWNRMLGKTTLFVPGFDHAGISTQSVVEKQLYKTGMTRHDLGPEAFVGKARITNQFRRLGGSYNWDCVAFTMNESLSKAVIKMFCRLHEDGILYRANRLVNWCMRLNTTLSNLEVEQNQLEGQTLLNVPGYDIKETFEFGVITSFAYPIENSDEKIVVVTTRPETMLGDTAIAVHPEDARYKRLHGKFAKHPPQRTRAGDLFIQPKSSESEWYRWLENAQRNDGKDWVVSRTLEEATNAKKVAGHAKGQDEDVLDTWFSSGLWPWSIMGWLVKMSDFDMFYPSSILETGWDILFIWVARMVLLGVHLTDKVRFSEVYCVEIWLRTRTSSTRWDKREITKAKAGQKKDFPKGIPPILRVEGYRKFCNKIFNATKFAMLKLDEKFVPEPTAKEAMKPMTDESASETTRKSAQQMFYTCLDHGLRLLHPFMPFVTEELLQHLPRPPNDPTPSIMLAKCPTVDKVYDFTKAERDSNLVFSALKSARGLAASYNILQNLHVYIRAENDVEAQLFQSQVPTFLALTKNLKSVKVVRDISGVPEGCGSELLTPTIFVHVLVRGQVDLDGEINKCEKKLALAKMKLLKIEKFESQADYETTVPESVCLANDEKRKTYEADIKLLEHSIDMFARMK